MTFPVIASSAESVQSANVTSHPITEPSGVTAGELLICVFSNDGSATVTWPGTWTQLFSTVNGTNNRLAAAYRFATGDANDDLAVTTSAGEHSAAFMIRITGAHASTPPEAGTPATGTSANPNPPALNPGAWDVEDTLWLAVTGMDGAGTLTSGPASYTAVGDGYARGTGSAANSALIAFFQRDNAIASEDPGTFTLTSENWVANTIAVRPAPATTDFAGASDAVADQMTGAMSVAKAIGGASEAVAAHAGRVRRLSIAVETFDMDDGPVLGPVFRWQRQVFTHAFPAKLSGNEMLFAADVGDGVGYEEIQVPTTVPATTDDAAVSVEITDIDWTGTGPSVGDWGGILRYVPRDNNTNYRGYASAFGRSFDTFIAGTELWHVLLFRVDGVGVATLLASAFALAANAALPVTFRFQIEGTHLIAHAEHAGTGPPLHVEVDDATYTNGPPASGGSLVIPVGGTGSLRVDNYQVFYFDAVTLASAAGQRPADVYDSGNTVTLPPDVYDAGNSATPPTDIYDANLSDATDEATAEHAATIVADRPIVGASDAIGEMVADLTVETGGAVDFAGASDAVGETAGALNLALAIAGASDAVGLSLGAIQLARDLAAAADGVAEHVAALTTRDTRIEGASDAVAEFVGDISIAGTVTYEGTLEAVAEHVASTLVEERAIAAALDAVAQHVADLARNEVFAGDSQAVAEHVADLNIGAPIVFVPPPVEVTFLDLRQTAVFVDRANTAQVIDPRRVVAVVDSSHAVGVEDHGVEAVTDPDTRIAVTDPGNLVSVTED